VAKMNTGRHSVYQCPGPYTLQVAEFTGRATIDPKANATLASLNPGQARKLFGESPLGTAYDDAEQLADRLSRCKAAQGFRPYVYHDLTCSRVTLGAFRSATDPALVQLEKQIPLIVQEMAFDGKTAKVNPNRRFLARDEMVFQVFDRRTESRTNPVLVPVPVVVGTAEGLKMYDDMVQKTGNTALNLIPLPAAR
jgi:hypothetical protein